MEVKNCNFSKDELHKLIDANKDDSECLEMIFQCVQSFADYHSAIFEMEVKREIFRNSGIGSEAYQDMVSTLDRTRTANHNAVLASVSILNRIAEKSNVAPIYEGVVSEDRPYRREVADAVLAYVECVINDRP